MNTRRRKTVYRFDDVHIPSDTVHKRPRKRLRFPLIRTVLVCALLTALGIGALNGYRAFIGPFEIGWWFIPQTVRVWRPAFLHWPSNLIAGPVRVGVQIGHLHADQQPDELAGLRFNFGGHANSVNEVDINEAIGHAIAAELSARGIVVDILPATIPAGYRADVVVAIHADSTNDPTRRGYKSAHFSPARNPYEALLKVEIDRQFLYTANRANDDHNVSGNMLYYYAFDHRRFFHAVDPRTPALLIETGYISHPEELRFLQDEHTVAVLVADGIMSYLRAIGRVWP